MPVDTRHPCIQGFIDQWTRCRAATAGEDAVKAAGEVFLPKLAYQEQQAYDSYRMRAMFFSASGRTVEGLTGAIMRRRMTINFPKKDDPVLKHLGSKGESLNNVAKCMLAEVISMGYVGHLVDGPAEGEGEEIQPYVTFYWAENIISLKTEMLDGREEPIMIVLEEEYEEPDPNDKFVCKKAKQYRVLELVGGERGELKDEELGEYGIRDSEVEGGIYRVQIWRQTKTTDMGSGNAPQVYSPVQEPGGSWRPVETIFPKIKGGKLLHRIPFVFVNPEGIDPWPRKSPILDLVNVNLSHYRNSADLEHGRHFCGLPTPVVTGADPEEPLTVGASEAWVLKDPQAHAFYMEFSGAALNHLQAGMEQKERLMAVLGSRLLEEQKKAAETAEAMTMRTSGEQSALANISDSCSEGLTKILYYVGMWMGLTDDPSKYEVRLNKDFNVMGADSATLTALMASVQQGMLSWNTWFEYCQRKDIVPETRSMEEEAALIQAGPPMGIPEPPGEEVKPGSEKNGEEEEGEEKGAKAKKAEEADDEEEDDET